MEAIFTFLFETRSGFLALFVGGIALFTIVAFVMERRTQKMFVDRGERKDDEDGFTGLLG